MSVRLSVCLSLSRMLSSRQWSVGQWSRAIFRDDDTRGAAIGWYRSRRTGGPTRPAYVSILLTEGRHTHTPIYQSYCIPSRAVVNTCMAVCGRVNWRSICGAGVARQGTGVAAVGIEGGREERGFGLPENRSAGRAARAAVRGCLIDRCSALAAVLSVRPFVRPFEAFVLSRHCAAPRLLIIIGQLLAIDPRFWRCD